MITINTPHSVRDLLQWAVLFLGKDKRLEAEVLLAEVCNYSRAKLLAYPEQILKSNQVKTFVRWVELRKQEEPLQYLTGKQSFMGLDFQVTQDVLIPRSDTEVLVEEVIKLASDMPKPMGILDLCTGSGAIAVSLAKHIQNCLLVATDISDAAVKVAQGNAQSNQVESKIKFLQGDLFAPLDNHERFDIIVSNPPYITTTEMQELPQDVQREPRLALWGGEEGLDFYRRITEKAASYLNAKGYLVMEIGYLQGEAVKQLCIQNGFQETVIIQDWSGNDRVVKSRKS